MRSSDYVTRVLSSPLEVSAAQWNALLAASPAPTPFMRHEYLAAMHTSGSAVPATGWTPQFVTLWQGGAPASQRASELRAACPLYLKDHSYGEYVFDWAWARAYQEHGVPYYPKALVAVPFTPVPGSRYLCNDISKNTDLPSILEREQLSFCEQKGISSLHVLFGDAADLSALDATQFMQRQAVQFHWKNEVPPLQPSLPPALQDCAPSPPMPVPRFKNFDEFLATLSQDKRKKIRAERRKVADAGITWRTCVGAAITASEWEFFYRCYERTYVEHGNAPYLTPAFFQAMADTMPENWVLFIASHSSHDVACSLIAVQDLGDTSTTNSIAAHARQIRANGIKTFKKIAYGRYWGALARVDSLHFEACYYQPLQWCIDNGFDSFEGGAQGEHKMARGLLPVVTPSAHWLRDARFADAVQRFLQREGQGIEHYVEDLQGRSPFKQPPAVC